MFFHIFLCLIASDRVVAQSSRHLTSRFVPLIDKGLDRSDFCTEFHTMEQNLLTDDYDCNNLEKSYAFFWLSEGLFLFHNKKRVMNLVAVRHNNLPVKQGSGGGTIMRDCVNSFE